MFVPVATKLAMVGFELLQNVWGVAAVGGGTTVAVFTTTFTVAVAVQVPDDVIVTV